MKPAPDPSADKAAESPLSVTPRDAHLTRADLDAGIDLGGRYMLAAQRPDGNFVYEVDWTTGQQSRDDNSVRQAGATWGLALLYRETLDPAYRAALDRSLTWWEMHAGTADGRRWQRQQDAGQGQLGTVALVGLSLLERLAAPEGLTDPAVVRASLDAICTFVGAARLPDGGFHGQFDSKTGTYFGLADPYSSGEALLLLARSGLELGVPERVARALAWAQEDYDLFVAKPLAKQADPEITKGNYQWSSMIWFALASAGHAPEVWGRRLIEQALWMIDVHRTLARSRNTGYAYEGIVPAWEWARRTGDDFIARKLASVVHQGLRKLCSWQLGHPLAPAVLRSAPQQFHGGVQNHAEEPALRIDVTQHQVHALMVARKLGIDAAALLYRVTPLPGAEARKRPAAYKVEGESVPSRPSSSPQFTLAITHTYKGPSIHAPQCAVRCEVSITDAKLLNQERGRKVIRRLRRLLPELEATITSTPAGVSWITRTLLTEIQLAEIAAVVTFTLMRRVDEWIPPVSSGLLGGGSRFYLICEYRHQMENAKAALTLAVELLRSVCRQSHDREKCLREIADFQRGGRWPEGELSTPYFCEEAEHRGIPVHPSLPGQPILGLGLFQKRVRETFTSNTGILAVRRAQNKVHTVDTLRQAGIPVPEQICVNNQSDAVEAAKRIGYPVVVKPLDGNQGSGVSVKLMSEAAVSAGFDEAARHARRVIVESYIEGSDHRLLVVNGEFVAACQRIPGHVVGNGMDTVERLLEVLNSDPRRNGDLMYQLTFDYDAHRMLQEQGLTLESVPDDGQVVFLRSKANTSVGGTSKGITEQVHPDNRLLAIAAARALQLDVAGIDLITTDITRSYKETGGGICEVNSRPGVMDLHVYPLEGSPAMVAPSVLDMLFPRASTGRIPIIAIVSDRFDDHLSHSVAHLLQMAGYEVGLATHAGLWVGGDRISNVDSANFDGAKRALLHPCVSAAVIEVKTESMLHEGLAFDLADAVLVPNSLCRLPGSEEYSAGAAALIGSVAKSLILNCQAPGVNIVLAEAGKRGIYLSNYDNSLSEAQVRIIKVVKNNEAMVTLEASDHRKSTFGPIGDSAKIELAIAACHAIGVPQDVIEDAIRVGLDPTQSDPLLISRLVTPFGNALMATPRTAQEVDAACKMARSWTTPRPPDIVIHMSFAGDSELRNALDAQLQLGCARALGLDPTGRVDADLPSLVFNGRDETRRVFILTDNVEFFRKRLCPGNRTHEHGPSGEISTC